MNESLPPAASSKIKMPGKRVLIRAVIGVFIVVAVVLLGIKIKFSKQVTVNQTAILKITPPIHKLPVVQEDPNIIREMLPTDFIQEPDVQFTEGFESNKNSEFPEYTLKYISKKSPEEVRNDYVNYFRQNKWGLANIAEADRIAIVAAVQKDNIVTVFSSINSNRQNIVDITITKSRIIRK